MYWHTTFGIITTIEQIFTYNKKTIRPFATSANISCRGYSFPLQRVITDFGADVSFKATAEKIKEHYSIEIPESSIRIITEKHAEIMHKNIDKIQNSSMPDKAPNKIISQIDGSMVPIVNIDHSSDGDKRKTRKIEWREARLALARSQGSITPFFGAVIGSVKEAGAQLAKTVKAVGEGPDSKIHGIGDGATWIVEQFDAQFGTKSTYTIDIHHLSEYLVQAADCCDPENKDKWWRVQRDLMKVNKMNKYSFNLRSISSVYPT